MFLFVFIFLTSMEDGCILMIGSRVDMEKKKFAAERQKEIIRIINKENTVEVKSLAERLDVTEATIRRDLIVLEENSQVQRTHGGAIAVEDDTMKKSFSSLDVRKASHYASKLRIARYVADNLINDGDSIMMDGGSTTLVTASEIALLHTKLTVITNAESIAVPITTQNAANKAIITGGEFTTNLQVQVGPIAENSLKSMHASKCIIGVSGIISNIGIFASNPFEAQIKKLMLLHSQMKIIVTDSSKFGIFALSKVTDFSDVDILVTDIDADPAFIKDITTKGVKIIQV